MTVSLDLMHIFRLSFLIFALIILSSESYGADPARMVLTEINLARSNPRSYAGFLRDFRREYHGKSYRLPGSRAMVRTTEGTRAVDEAIRFLDRQRALHPLAWSAGLAAAAAELVAEEGQSGAVGHFGKPGSGPRQRIERHGNWQGAIGEAISYGPDEARLVVMQLIIDDGVPDRGHRKNIFNRVFSLAGVACGPHPTFERMCAIDFASEFNE